MKVLHALVFPVRIAGVILGFCVGLMLAPVLDGIEIAQHLFDFDN